LDSTKNAYIKASTKNLDKKLLCAVIEGHKLLYTLIIWTTHRESSQCLSCAEW